MDARWDSESGPWGPPRRPGLRARAKRWASRLASLGRAANDPADGVAILAYHATEREPGHPWWLDFRGQMDLLERLGYEIVALADAVERIRSGRIGDRPVAALTFDDGWASNLEVAYPDLRRRGWPATVFLATSFVGRRPFLLEEEVRRLSEFGVSVELHTDAHPDLTTIDDARIAEDLARCGSRIAALTGRQPTMLCYPFGRVDRRVRDAVAHAGVAAACCSLPGRNRPGSDPWMLRRITVDPGEGIPELRASLAGAGERLASLKELVTRRDSRWASPYGTPGENPGDAASRSS